jgi:hypothetical protein
MKGFKGFNADFTCRGKKYEENKNFVEFSRIELCRSGMHFCMLPLQTFKFYPPEEGNIYAKVESKGAIDIGVDKVVTDNLQVLNKMTIKEMFEEHTDLIRDMNTTEDAIKIKEQADTKLIDKSEPYVTLENSGIRAFISSDCACIKEDQVFSSIVCTGEETTVFSKGSNPRISTLGKYSNIYTEDRFANVSSFGSDSNIFVSGVGSHVHSLGSNSIIYGYEDCNHLHSSRIGSNTYANGDRSYAISSGEGSSSSVKGKDSIAASVGYNGRAKAGKNGSWIVIADWRPEKTTYKLHGVYTAKVGDEINGVKIEPDTWYWFEDGELMEKKEEK